MRLDPLRTGWRPRGQRGIEDRERLPVATVPADPDDLLVPVEVDALDGDGDSQDHRPEGNRTAPGGLRYSSRV